MKDCERSVKRGFYDKTVRQIDGWTELKIERQIDILRQRKKDEERSR